MVEDLPIRPVSSGRPHLLPFGRDAYRLSGVPCFARRCFARRCFAQLFLAAPILAGCSRANGDLFDTPLDVAGLAALPADRDPSVASGPNVDEGATGGGGGAQGAAGQDVGSVGLDAGPVVMGDDLPGSDADDPPSSEDDANLDPGADQEPLPAPGAPLACPPAASFCSGFEGPNLPAGATYVSQRGDFVPGQSLLLDASQSFSGEQSLLVPRDGLMGFDYRMLSVAIPANDFWVRLYVRTDVEFGDSNDDVFLLGSVLADGFNGDRAMQVSEQFDQIVLNKNGQLHGATRENPSAADVGTRLAADEWHCLEAFFGGTSGDASVLLAGQPIITAVAWQVDTYQSFRFGYQRYNTERNVWIDDVAVAAERIGCE